MKTIKELIKASEPQVTIATFDIFKNRVTTMYFSRNQWHVFQYGVRVFQGSKEQDAVQAFLHAQDLFELKRDELKPLQKAYTDILR